MTDKHLSFELIYKNIHFATVDNRKITGSNLE